jgi:hypothetical protein
MTAPTAAEREKARKLRLDLRQLYRGSGYELVLDNAEADNLIAQALADARTAALEEELSHEDFCSLSRRWNMVANLSAPQDARINEWLKRQIATAYRALAKEPT